MKSTACAYTNMPSKKQSKKVDNRRTIDHEHFCRLIVEGVSPRDALIRAGGKDGVAAKDYAQKLKAKYAEKTKQMALEMASDGMYSMIRLAPKAVKVIEDAFNSDDVSASVKAKLAKDVLGNIQALLPKQTVHEHKHTHEISEDRAQEAAKLLLAQLRGVDGRASSSAIDADFEEQSAGSECDSSGSGEEPK